MKLDTSGKIVAWIVVFGAIVGTYIIANDYFEQKRIEDGVQVTQHVAPSLPVSQPVAQSAETVETISGHFIGECSGMSLADESVHLYAVTECLGRVRGFVDGHNVTVAMANQVAGKSGAESIQLFCVNPDIGADELVDSIMNWVDSNIDVYVNIVTADPHNGATIVIIKALRANYPCANT